MRFVPNDAKEGFSWITRAIIVGLVLLIVYELAIQKPRSAPDPVPIFSPYSQSSFALETAIKKTMHDPDSYEHVETTHKQRGNVYYVNTAFRGKNALGATVLSKAEALIDSKDGHVISWNMIK